MTLDNPVAAKDIATLPSGAQIVHATATAVLSLSERNVFASVNTATDSIVLTLPDVAEAAGLFYYIRADIANGKTVTVEDNGNDAGLTNIVLDGDNEFVFLYSTGKEWIAPDTVGYS